MTDLELKHYDAQQTRQVFDRLVEVYLEVYADDDDEFFGGERYRKQLTSHMNGQRFELVAAYADGDMVGYVYGYTLPADARWWRGLRTETRPELTVETGSRTFALCEIMVRQPWRGTGVGRALHDELLKARGEERATLLVEPDNAARDTYLHWNWQKIGQVRPSWEGAPLYDALVLPLTQG